MADDLTLVDGDIRNPKTAERVVDTALQRFGRLDLLINNAGVFIPKPFTGYTPDDFRTVTETNLAGFFYVSQPAVAQMRVQKSGHVVNITASIANQPVAGLPATLASLTKGGLESVVRALAIEFAGEGIRFNAIAPGAVNIVRHEAGPNEPITSSCTSIRVDKGGHFAAWEQPQLFSEEIRAAFRPLQ